MGLSDAELKDIEGHFPVREAQGSDSLPECIRLRLKDIS
jgi:hypothetical protein